MANVYCLRSNYFLRVNLNINFLRETDPSDAHVGARRGRLVGGVSVLGNWKIVSIAARSCSPNLGERVLIRPRNQNERSESNDRQRPIIHDRSMKRISDNSCFETLSSRLAYAARELSFVSF